LKALRVIGACACAVAVLLAGAWSGGALALPARPPSHAREGEIPVGDALEVGGQPMRLSLFYTSDAPVRVIRFYADAFRGRGLLPIVAADPGLSHVAAFDPGEHRQRFVTAVSQLRGQTLVLLGSIDRRRTSLTRTAATSFPVPDPHRGYLAFRSSDAGSSAESAQFVSPLAPVKVASFYRDALARAGYRETTDTPGGALLTFTRPGAAVSVAMQTLEGAAGSAVFVTRSEGQPL
jgi:hypothetical protein